MQPIRRHADPAVQAEFNHIYGLVAPLLSALDTMRTAIGLTVGTTAPAAPVAGQRWLDTNYSPARLKTWSGTDWLQTYPGVP